MSDTYLLSVTGKAKNVVVSYLSIGVKPEAACQKCNTSLVMYKFACVDSCSVGMSVYNFSSSSKGCVMCQPSAGFKSNSQGCSCSDGKTLIRGSCVDNSKLQFVNLSSS